MINGYLQLNILILYPDNNQDKDILLKQGFRIENSAYFKNLLKSESVLKYSNIKDSKEFYKKLYHSIFTDNKQELDYVYVGNAGILHYGKVKDLDTYKLANKEYSVSYDAVNRKYTLNYQTSNLLTSQLEEDNKADRYTIKINNFNDTSFKIEYEINSIKHDYYSEVINTQLLSSMQDSYNISTDKLLIDVINTKNEEITELKNLVKELINVLGSNPAVQGTPILLPTDITNFNNKFTQLEQKQKDNFDMNSGTIESINESIGGIYNAKQ